MPVWLVSVDGKVLATTRLCLLYATAADEVAKRQGLCNTSGVQRRAAQMLVLSRFGIFCDQQEEAEIRFVEFVTAPAWRNVLALRVAGSSNGTAAARSTSRPRASSPVSEQPRTLKLPNEALSCDTVRPTVCIETSSFVKQDLEHLLPASREVQEKLLTKRRA